MKLVYGAGINDMRGKSQTRAYTSWALMLQSVFKPEQRMLGSARRDNEVAEEWLTFSNFYEWFTANRRPQMNLTKDVLQQTNLYSPETCCFAPIWLIAFVTNARQVRDLPPGVMSQLNTSTLNPYKAMISVPLPDGRRRAVYLGSYPTPEEAHRAWLREKQRRLTLRRAELDAIDERLYPAVMAQFQID